MNESKLLLQDAKDRMEQYRGIENSDVEGVISQLDSLLNRSTN